MNYSEDESMCRVDFWKIRGEGGLKWGYTEAVDWDGHFKGELIHDAFRNALREHFEKTRGHQAMRGMLAICADPYHKHAHPIAITIPEEGL